MKIKTHATRLKELIEYLKQAKQHQYAIEVSDLCIRYNLTSQDVKKEIGKIFL